MKEVTAKIVAVLLTLAEEAPGTTVAESMIYLALGMDLRMYEIVKGVMVQAGWITVSNHRICLTDAGRDYGAKIQASMAKPV